MSLSGSRRISAPKANRFASPSGFFSISIHVPQLAGGIVLDLYKCWHPIAFGGKSDGNAFHMIEISFRMSSLPDRLKPLSSITQLEIASAIALNARVSDSRSKTELVVIAFSNSSFRSTAAAFRAFLQTGPHRRPHWRFGGSCIGRLGPVRLSFRWL